MTAKDDGMTIKDTQKHRNLFIACAVVAVIAIAVGGFWVWTSVERSTALADCNESVKLAKTGVADYVKTRDSAAKMAKAVPQGDVSNVKVINAVIVTKDKVSAAAIPSCPADASKHDLTQSKSKADTLAKDAAAATKDVRAASSKLVADEHKTVKSHLDKTIQDADQTFKDTDGKVADNATRDNLSKVLDAARKVQSNAKVSTAEYRKAIDDLNNSVKGVNDSKSAKDQADQAAAQQAQAEAEATANAGTSGAYVGSGYARRGYSGGGYRAPSGGGSNVPAAGGNGGGNGEYTPSPPREYTQEQKDRAHHYECVMHPDITTGC